MQITSRRVGLWLSTGVITVAVWLVVGTGHDNAYLGPYVVLAALASLAGWWGDRVAALVIYTGGIAGATMVAVAAGAVGVEPSADPAMRSSYYAMLVFLAAAVAAVLGLFVVAGGYLVGRLVRRLRPETSDPLR
jgi:hypothetical protein